MNAYDIFLDTLECVGIFRRSIKKSHITVDLTQYI